MRTPPLGPAVPRRDGAALRALGRWALGFCGWRFEGEFPDVSRCVIIVAPHTSNWDFAVGVAALLALELRVTWLGKHTLFRGPLSALWRALGGVPVDRAAPDGVVESAAALFARGAAIVAVSPEGTRSRVERWKSGFWRIARAGGVPVLPVAFDYARRTLVFHALFAPTGDFDADVAALKRHFDPAMARYPARY